MVSHKHRFIFIHIPKTAGTSIEKAFGHFETISQSVQDHRTIRELEPLNRAFGKLNKKENMFILAKRVRDQVRGIYNSNLKPITVNDQEFDSYFKFAFVRNPWSRVVSWYKNVMRDELHQKEHKVTKNCGFEEFLEKHTNQWALRPQLFWLKNSSGELGVDFVGKFESLEQDFSKACERIGVDHVQLPKMLDGNIGQYANYYNQRTRKIVSELYAEEIEMFEYAFER